MTELLATDADALKSLIQLFAISDTMARRLISEPEIFESLRTSSFSNPAAEELLERLTSELASVDHASRAAIVVRHFFTREIMRIAFGEFVRGTSPDQVGRELARLFDTMIQAALQFTMGQLSDRRGLPVRADGTHPEVTVIATGSLGGENPSYSSSLKLIFLFDAIDPRNVWHRDFYETLVRDLVNLLCGDQTRSDVIDVDLRAGPRHEVGVHICSIREAARIYETSGRTSQRLKFVNARVVAGSQSLGQAFLDRLQPWVYRQFNGPAELAEIQAIRHMLQRRSEQEVQQVDNFSTAAGGIEDVELIVQFLQLLHGGYLPSVRQNNIYDAIASLNREGCLSEQEASDLSQRYARLARLKHQLSISFDQRGGTIPTDEVEKQRIAWQLGIRDQSTSPGDVAKFEKLLIGTLAENRKLIGILMQDDRVEPNEPAADTELLLEPIPDPIALTHMMRRYGFESPDDAIEHLASLSRETVPFLSHQRCRHVFASLAPELLSEISQTPNPDDTLETLVQVTDSLGAKAELWDLLRTHKPMLNLVVRMCATTPYLASILTENPGMIDELVDSLLIDHLPSAQRLDAHSIELCRGISDFSQVMHGFKNSAHLTIGVRHMLGKETIEATHAALGDTADACLRRVIEHEQEIVAQRYGDPLRADGTSAQVIALALGKLGGHEPNYHSDLDVLLLYCGEGETERRVGGRRHTTTNHLFFNQVARQVIDRVNDVNSGATGSTGRLYELNSRLRLSDDEGVLSISFDDFLQTFTQRTAPLWHWMALCKARVFSGHARERILYQERIESTLASFVWAPSVANELRVMRARMQEAASPSNMKRGVGGTVDVEWIAQMLLLRHGSENSAIIRQGTINSINAIEKAGHLSQEDASTLIRGYRILRRAEANLRLMNAEGRHELPDNDRQMKKLAYLMGEPNAETIRQKCDAARKSNRKLFDRIIDSNATETAD